MSEWKIDFIDPADGHKYLAVVYRPKDFKPQEALVADYDPRTGSLAMMYVHDPDGVEGYEIWDLGFTKDVTARGLEYTLLVNGPELEEVTTLEPSPETEHPRRAKVTIVSSGGSGPNGVGPAPIGKPARGERAKPKYVGPKLVASIQVDLKKGKSKIKPRIPIIP